MLLGNVSCSPIGPQLGNNWVCRQVVKFIAEQRTKRIKQISWFLQLGNKLNFCPWIQGSSLSCSAWWPRATNWILGSAGRNPVCRREETRTFAIWHFVLCCQLGAPWHSVTQVFFCSNAANCFPIVWSPFHPSEWELHNLRDKRMPLGACCHDTVNNHTNKRQCLG